MIFGILGLAAAALFAGAAIYVSFVEHPARETLDARAQLTQWKPSYARGARMQGGLALIAFALGVVAWMQTKELRWLAAGAVILAAWPYTLLRIMPVNNRLKETPLGSAGVESRGLLEHWGRLHFVRTLLGVASTALFVWAATG
jgi:uncharacterized membrane protein